jgi:hypothetical protein
MNYGFSICAKCKIDGIVKIRDNISNLDNAGIDKLIVLSRIEFGIGGVCFSSKEFLCNSCNKAITEKIISLFKEEIQCQMKPN